MATRNIVPRATGEGSLGTNAKKWGDVYANNVHGSLDGNATSATSATNDADGNDISLTYAPKDSPAFTGNPTAPTQAANNNSTRVATTAYVVNDLKANAPLLSNTFITKLTSDDDLDSVTTAGTYYWDGNAPANVPTDTIYAKMFVLHSLSSGWVKQIVFRHVNMQIWYRSGRIISGSWNWNTWKQFAFAEDVLPLTGGTITGTLIVTNNVPRTEYKWANLTKGGNPASNYETAFVRLMDVNNTTIGSISKSVAANGLTSIRIYNQAWHTDSTTYYIALFCTADDNVNFQCGTDNKCGLGTASYRWKQLFAGTTTISTSDERLKDNITNIPDAVLDAWGEVGWYQYQFKDSIEEKGETKARIHTGAIAQRIESIFSSHGLDANRYGLLCYDSWKAEPEERDEEGNITQEARPAGNRYSLRYEEALCMEAAYQRRRADRLEERIARLEALINNIEK